MQLVLRGTYHDVDFFLDFGKHCLVSNGNPLKHMLRRVVYRCGGPHEIDMGEPTYSVDEETASNT